MGCDIHVCLEVRSRYNDKWYSAELYKKDGDGFEKTEVYDGRNYSLFEALCGVRDRHGLNPRISDPRGLPDDCTDETRADREIWGVDGHSASWNLLSELYEYQSKHPKVTHKGLISVEEAKRLDELGIAPYSWCQGSSDKSKVWREWQANYGVMDGLIDSIERQLYKFYIFSPRDNADRVRIVYWFDN